MAEEIKEILKYIDQFVYVDQTYNDIKLSKIDTKLILDYITNLQQEKSDICKNRLAIAIERDRLQQENEKLKEENEELNRMCELYSKSLYNAELIDYKSRCEGTINLIDRTIEIIKQQPTKDDSWILSRLYGFKYSLNGSDENE